MIARQSAYRIPHSDSRRSAPPPSRRRMKLRQVSILLSDLWICCLPPSVRHETLAYRTTNVYTVQRGLPSPELAPLNDPTE
ncbi:hypothetical protein BH24GEM2_BH24GEM2_08500 [soil metagenome]